MKTIIIACVTAAVIAIIGMLVLNSVQVPADKGFADPASVRLGFDLGQDRITGKLGAENLRLL